MSAERVDVVVAGAGVVGLAIARALVLARREVIVLEAESTIGTLIEGPAEHGIAGLVNLFGIESPGLTAALVIGDNVRGLLRG